MSNQKTISGAESETSRILTDSDFGKPAIEQLQLPKRSAYKATSGTADTGQEKVRETKKVVRPGKKIAEEKIYGQYRRYMDELIEELDKASDYLVQDDKLLQDDKLSDEGSTVTTEVDELLRRLAECPWGEGESLRLAVTVLRIPTRNARWTRKHVEFLKEAVSLLRAQYLIDRSTVEMCKQSLKAHGLDIFQGSVTEPDVVRRYKLIEIGPNEQ